MWRRTKFSVGEATLRGLPAQNQDSMSAFTARISAPELGGGRQIVQVAVVADGVNGQPAGDVASKLAVDKIKETFAQGERHIRSHMEQAIRHANTAIYEKALQPSTRGMGTTVVLAAIDSSNYLYVAHVGDSRAYLIRKGKAHLLTQDHTRAEQLVSRGQMTVEKAQHDPTRYELVRQLGQHRNVSVDLAMRNVVAKPDSGSSTARMVKGIRLRAGDRVLLCSDGIPNELSDQRIGQIASGGWRTQTAARRLVNQASQAGGRDNMTAVVIGWRNWGRILLLALLGLIVAGIATTTLRPNLRAALVEALSATPSPTPRPANANNGATNPPHKTTEAEVTPEESADVVEQVAETSTPTITIAPSPSPTVTPVPQAVAVLPTRIPPTATSPPTNTPIPSATATPVSTPTETPIPPAIPESGVSQSPPVAVGPDSPDDPPDEVAEDGESVGTSATTPICQQHSR